LTTLTDVREADQIEAARTGGPDAFAVLVARVCLALALVPLAVAAARAIREGWVPVGDSALVAVRTRDVLGGGEMPQLGMWASTSWTAGFNMNHPGPLLYVVMAVPAALWGGGTGMVLGSAVVNCLSTAGIYVVARRRQNPLVPACAMAVTAGLCWSMGSAVLVEPWHATTILLPFLLFAMLVWSTVSGDLVCLPWAAVVGSLVLQTNLSFSILVPALSLAAGAGLVLAVRRRSRPATAPDSHDPSPARIGRITAMTVGAGLLCWSLPLVDQFTGDGEGNLSRLRRGLGVDIYTLNWREAVKVVAKLVALPPWWGRPSYAEAFPNTAFGNPLPTAAATLVALAALAGVLAGLARGARLRGDRESLALVVVAALLVVLAVVSGVETPSGTHGTIAYQLRWLWPVSAFVSFAVVGAVAGRFASSALAVRRGSLVALAATLAFAALNVPASDQGTTAAPTALPVARSLAREVAAADLDGPLLVHCGEGVFDPYCEAVLVVLQDQGVEFRTDDAVGVRQLGREREWDGANAEALLTVVAGDLAMLPPPGQTVVTERRGLSNADQTELFYLVDALKTALADGAIKLNARGEAVAARGGFASVRRGTTTIDPEVAIGVGEGGFGEHRRELVAMSHEDLVDADGLWADRLARYAELQHAWDDRTVAVFLGPLPERGSGD
jgi:hypothetical protein